MRLRVEVEPRRASESQLARLDRVAAEVSPDDPAMLNWYQTYAQQHRDRLAFDLEMLERVAPAGARILELGAVPLLMTAALDDAGYDVSAVDVAPGRFANSISELELDVREVDVERDVLPFESGSFRVVLMNELFEHLRIDPIFTLSETLRVLEPGGQLLLSTPNLRSLRGVRNLLVYNRAYACSAGVYRQYEKLKLLGHMGHVREYTTREVSEFLERIGFVPQTLVFRGGHGRGAVGLLERLLPTWRPFVSVIAEAPRSAARADGEGS